MNIATTLNKAKENPELLEQILNPGKQLSDFNLDNLRIDILPSGFPSLDDMLLFKKGRGELVIVGARPSQGKSSLIYQLATNIAAAGKAHVISLEDEHDAIATRQIAGLINKPIDYIQRGLIPRNELEKAKSQLIKLNCVIDDRSGLNVKQICDAVRMQNRKQHVDVVFIDYVQIIKSERKFSRHEDIAEITGELKALAKEIKSPVVVASQLNRTSEFREGGLPQLSDLKESGSLEQDADIVLLIHRKGTEANIIVAKNKNGKTGNVAMTYALAQTRFIDRQFGVEVSELG